MEVESEVWVGVPGVGPRLSLSSKWCAAGRIPAGAAHMGESFDCEYSAFVYLRTHPTRLNPSRLAPISGRHPPARSGVARALRRRRGRARRPGP